MTFLLLFALAQSVPLPRTPAVDYVVPAAAQPFASDPSVIWYDSFDDPARLGRYFEVSTHGGLFGLSQDEALGGAGLSLRGKFEKGTVSAGSLKVTFGDSPLGRTQARAGEKFTEVYWRVYVKHQRGWTGNPAKLSRATSLAGREWSQAMIAHVWGGRGDVLTLDPATGIGDSGKLATRKYNDFERLGWLGNQPPAGYPIFATEESGKWVAVEASATLNTPGRSDGTFRLWIDGRLEAYRDGLNWRGTWDERGINAVFLENYWNTGSPVEQVRYFDDLVISTKPIGLARAPLNPEVVLTPFEGGEGSSQSAFQVQVANQDLSDIVWDSGPVQGKSNRIVVDSAHGRFRGALAPGRIYAVRVRQCDSTGRWSAWCGWRNVIQIVEQRSAVVWPATPTEP